MILQRIELPASPDMEKSLYYKIPGKAVTVENGVFAFSEGSILDFLTYFNTFSASKWQKYTQVKTVNFTFDFCGHLSVAVYHEKYIGSVKVSKLLRRMELKSETEVTHTMNLGKLPDEGIIGVTFEAHRDGTRIWNGFYGTADSLDVSDIHIGIGICTFKREMYVERNMNLLKQMILDNPKALSQGHYSVCISDNAGTLDEAAIMHSSIRVVKNKNLGGVGGFTRAMLEHMHSGRPLTHVLLMDDDAMIEPAALERTYRFLTVLKPEYEEYVLGGALIRLDQPTIQYESGAKWNRGDIEALKMNYDLSQLEYVVRNELEDAVEYVGWWYSCIPVSQIKESQLPLPLFLHRDDIEFGLRAKGFILLNGICVWHEAFQNKLPGAVEYYDIRNLGIINAIHYPDYNKRAFKKELFIAVSSNIGKYRYKYVSLNLKGAVDFLRGFEWFYQADTMAVHQSLSRYNYVSRPLEAYLGYHGLTKTDLENYTQEGEIPSLPVRLFRIISMNGTFFPTKSRKPKVAIPWPNIYDLYRRSEVIYVDNNGKGVGVKRSAKNLVKAYIQLFKVFRLIDRRFDDACREYRVNYEKLIQEDFWKKYLDME